MDLDIAYLSETISALNRLEQCLNDPSRNGFYEANLSIKALMFEKDV